MAKLHITLTLSKEEINALNYLIQNTNKLISEINKRTNGEQSHLGLISWANSQEYNLKQMESITKELILIDNSAETRKKWEKMISEYSLGTK